MSIYQKAIENVECAFAYHKAVFDEQDEMIDYIFLDINHSFELATGLSKQDIINKRFIKDIAKDKKAAKKWVDIYKQVFKQAGNIEFNEYAEEYHKHYLIKAFATDQNHFVTVFLNKTFEKMLIEMGDYFMHNMGSMIDYDKITQFAHDVSGAEYVAFNLFDDNGHEFTTVALEGVKEIIKDGLKLFKLDPIGKKWAYDQVREEKILNNDITYFDSLIELVQGKLPLDIVNKLQDKLNLGKVVIAKIIKDDKLLGDFTMIFKKNQELKNIELLKIYLLQLGLFIEKTKLERSLISSQKRFYTLAEYAPVGFLSCDIEGNITYANKKLLALMDSPSFEETKKINLLTLPQLKQSGFSLRLQECMLYDRSLVYEMNYKSIWDKQVWLKVYFTPRKEDGKITGANIVIDDVSTKKKVEDELRETAFKDSLTGAYNRYALDTFLPDLLYESRENQAIGCLALIDLDDFKEINDEYGHVFGDSVLKRFTSNIKQQLRDADMLVRTGGDEFLIYLHDVKSEKNAEDIIKRIFDNIATHYRIEDTINNKIVKIIITCSIGAVFFPRHGQTVEELMGKADEALYQVKKENKARYCFIK